MSLGGRLLRGLAIAAGALLLTFILIAARFPWDRLAPTVSAQATEASGVPIEIGGFEFSFGKLGVSLLATDVHIGWPDATGLDFPRVAARPAFTLDWFSGNPALRVLTENGPANFNGVVTRERAEGRLAVPEAEALPWRQDAPVAGAFRAKLALRFGQDEASGTQVLGDVDVTGSDGSIFPPGIPVAIPFDLLDATLAFTPTGLELSPLHVDGPMVSGSVTGTLHPRSGNWERAGLDLTVVIDRVDRGLSGMLAGTGVDLTPGRQFAIRGTAAAPVVR